MIQPTHSFPPIEKEHLYSISQIMAETRDWKAALETILHRVRPMFIFDNVVVYQTDPKSKTLDAAFARATGRGKSAEADVSWGEAFANQIVVENKIVHELPADIQTDDRLQRPLTLGIPLRTSGRVLGAMIFIRFGSPIFTEEDVHFAEFLTQQVTLMIERQMLRTNLDQLQSVYQLFQLQEDFISTLSHEIRNPLGFIKGYTTTLLRPNTSWDEATQQEFLTIIDKETDRLQDLIENLLDSARLQSGAMKMDLQPVRVDAVINNVISRAIMHNPDLLVNVDVPEVIRPIYADARRLAQVFENLINNAVKYAPGSEVQFSVENTLDGVSINISDEGPGIPAQSLPQLFQRFYRVPDRSIHVHGSGLGLFICKQIIDAHQGTIEVKSEIDAGTQFKITLPRNPVQS
ncbi:MAG TPA: ATP-binding protein [Anaerolineaceae bacterium]|nr:ATP-binding protein [Anaerolineaceae bacterium]